MNPVTANDLDIYEKVRIGNYEGIKLTEDNFFCINVGGERQFDNKSATYDNPRFAAHGCNVWKDSDIRRSINKGPLFDRLVNEEECYNLEETTVVSKIGKAEIATKDIFFLPSIEDTKSDWWKECMTLMSTWRKTYLWLRDGRGETGTAYYDVQQREVKFSDAFTYKRILALCKVKGNTLFSKKDDFSKSVRHMDATKENIPGLNIETFTNFIM